MAVTIKTRDPYFYCLNWLAWRAYIRWRALSGMASVLILMSKSLSRWHLWFFVLWYLAAIHGRSDRYGSIDCAVRGFYFDGDFCRPARGRLEPYSAGPSTRQHTVVLLPTNFGVLPGARWRSSLAWASWRRRPIVSVSTRRKPSPPCASPSPSMDLLYFGFSFCWRLSAWRCGP